ncbi:sensor histidine kinase YrkQ [Clostridium aceticum]|uniref:histidine kinase n=1 Tax=Clostridium aceticum TaxID=84022 RepID=A0A0D8IB26_9CLOT|nr:HAMP domain-containing sensor histidine kinase [Clostridium aceticum]AKL96557.1 sensor histidine kinase YrkQ [Clostridium aceticum]KJF27284.1 hypothetical protein TZ02_08030 [Clostridium aceticum]
MARNKQPVKLYYKLGISGLLAFMLSILIFLTFQSLTSRILTHYCTNPEVISYQEQKKVADLQRYIFDHNLSVYDFPQIAQWVEGKGLTMISIYYNNLLIYDSHSSYSASSLDYGIDISPLPWQKLYPICFSDHKAFVVVLDLFQHRFQDYSTYFSLLMFFISFIAIIHLLIIKKAGYINILVKEIKGLQAGNLNQSITIKGKDELTELAKGIDEMRKTFILREEYTNELKAASNEVMARISHDLRTPLTTIIGYLDIMVGQESSESSNSSSYLSKCRARALQLKTLIDNLFQYFFVSTQVADQESFTTCFGATELDKIIQDHLFLLEQQGFFIQNKTTNDRYAIEIHLDLIQRLFDNLFSNILKYADPSYPVKIINYIENNIMVVELSNSILQSPQTFESTKLGFKTCEKIMEQHHGKFIVHQDKTEFMVKLLFPILE